MIRVCPKRDAICPHGDGCPYSIDRYECRDEITRPIPADPTAETRAKLDEACLAMINATAAYRSKSSVNGGLLAGDVDKARGKLFEAAFSHGRALAQAKGG